MVDRDAIEEVGIDDSGRLYVRPAFGEFQYIYRAGMEVSWDPARIVLLSPVPRDWTYSQWFRHILLAVKVEYGVALKCSRLTIWRNVPDQVKLEMEARPS